LNPARRRLGTNIAKLVDLGLLGLSLGFTTVVIVLKRGSISLHDLFTFPVKFGNFLFLVALFFLWHLIFSMFGLYESKRLSTRRSEVIDSLKAITLVTLTLLLPATFLAKRTITLSFLALFWLSSLILVIGVRLAVRYVLAFMRRRGRNCRYILILGTNSRAVEFAQRIEAKPELGYRVVGFVDNDWAGREEFLRVGYKVCCNFSELAAFLRKNVVDEVAIYLPLKSFYEHAAQVAAQCELHGILMRFNSDIFNLKIARFRAEDFEGDAQIMATSDRQDGWPFLVKRILDFIISLTLLAVLAPIFLIIALLIRFTTTGAVLFRQERVGLNKRSFMMYKFCTMYPDAEQVQEKLLELNEMTGPVFKIKNDPRVTSLGHFLRKTSLDELPQLWNVLKGDMSLVGPRAMSMRDYRHFDEDWQRRRFSVQPGITCLWQVNGRNSIPFEQWMELDMQYIDKWSLWLDLKILARTIPAVLRGSGAA
ncbi:MAG: sugar transferase, partial [Candidatus Acidiferrales bacterium]|jgi:exopolysaccharide biosynthesis polyprenyl glycosylphosphotransferase